MRRYLHSFLISSLFYSTLVAAIFYTVSADTYSYKKVQTENTASVRFSVVTAEVPLPNPVVEEKPKIEKKRKPKTHKPKIDKPKPKPKSETASKVDPKPLPQPQPELAPEPEQEPAQKPEKETETTDEQKPAAQHMVANTQKKHCINRDEIKAKQNIFIADLIHRINKNKSYPRSARRRHVEGSVEVKFKVLADGNVKDIKVVSANRVFEESAMQAIHKSFPMKIDSSIFSFPKEFTINIEYILR